MTKKILGAAIVLALCMPILAQQPQAKSQEELDALFEIESATDPDARIGAIHTLLTNFKGHRVQRVRQLHDDACLSAKKTTTR